MLELDGYQIAAPIYQSTNSIVYRGIREADQQAVILKMLQQDYPTTAELTCYRQEYEIVRRLNQDGIVRAYELKEYQRTLVLVLEDFGGNSLEQLLQSQGSLSLREFLEIASKIAQILGEVHRQNIIHRDLNPANIIYNPNTKEVKLADFGIATVLSRENPTLKNPDIIEGTLAYISPERTGRMNRFVDYRSDFYSLGITFYQLLSGDLPFTSNDSLELVHAHIAKIPQSLTEKSEGEIPQIVSGIVQKLMAKIPEERYQSAWGLEKDLEKCLQQLLSQGRIAPFSLAAQDIADRFQIPQKLYGREKEIASLLAAFDRISQVGESGSKLELFLVTGYSGVGKSALVAEVYKPITKARGYFISGKFEQFQCNIPYLAIVQALTKLVRQILTESESQLQQWRKKLLQNLDNNAQLIIDVIPELELIIGSQPPVSELGLQMAQNRFKRLFQNFIRVFCDRQHPLVIFLDDLQWADSASLKLLELILEDTDTRNLLVIGTYRDNEVTASHPLILTLEELKTAGVTIEKVSLQPLNQEHISDLLADTLNCERTRVTELADLAIKKTRGNPFFTNELLKILYEENFLQFDQIQHRWQWQLAKLEKITIADNVVDLMVARLQKLPATTQTSLKLAACIGTEFALDSLAVIAEESPVQVCAHLKEAINSELILSLSELDEQLLVQDYKFGHDRIQQAAYNLIEPSEKQILHLRIARLLWQETPTEKLSEKVFTIVDHFNLSLNQYGLSPLTLEPEEKQHICQLNLQAGRKAIAATAYEAAIRYLRTGIELLSDNCWESDYQITLELYSLATEAAYLAGNFEQNRQFAEVVIAQAKTSLDRVKIYEIRILALNARNQLLEAVQTALSVLEQFGISFPAEPGNEDIQEAFQTTFINLGDRNIAKLVQLTPMEEPEKLAIMKIITSVQGSTYIAAPTLLPLLILTQINLSLDYGNTGSSAIAYSYFGLLLCGIVGDIEKGYQFGNLALEIINRFQVKNHEAEVLAVYNATISIWVNSISQTIKPIQTGFQVGLETGNFSYAGICANLVALHSLYSGKNLTRLEPKIAAYEEAVAKIKRPTYLRYCQINHQTILNLLGKTPAQTEISNEIYGEKELLAIQIESNDRYGVLSLSLDKVYLLYLFGDYQLALEHLARAEAYLDGGPATLLLQLFYFYDSLARLAVYSQSKPQEQANILARVNSNQTKIQTWAEFAPHNHLHKYHLVEAEKHRVTESKYQAMEHYDTAIELAQANKFLNDEALANELAAKFYLQQEKPKFARVHFQEAHYCYSRWGAKAKIADLETKYPHFFNQSSTSQLVSNQFVSTPLKTAATITSPGIALDLATVIKASQAISGEIVLEKLLTSLMQILLQNAGAEKGYLILNRRGEFLIEAEGKSDSAQTQVLQSLPLNDSLLPLSLIQYVIRTRENVVLSNAAIEEKFARDNYIRTEQPKSVLCFPLLTQGKITSIVYLENNIVTGTFTTERLSILKVLSAQAAISIDNALLYQNLEARVAERTTQLSQANQKISKLNEQLQQENLRMGSELDIAKKLQQMVLPKPEELEQVADLDIDCFMASTDEVGGDYYDILYDEDMVTIGIGDVTGHGLESGILMLMTQTAVRTLQEVKESDPIRFLAALNRAIYQNVQRMDSEKNLTLAILNYSQGKLSISGQHEEVLVVRANGAIERIDTIDLGLPIGLDDNITEFIDRQFVDLNPGDGVVLYTDGITEAFNLAKQQYGLERLCEIVSQNWQSSPSQIKQAIVNDVREFIDQQKVFDDITLVVMKRK